MRVIELPKFGKSRQRAFGPVSAPVSGDTDAALDELTKLAATLCGADFAYLGWMYPDRLRFRSCHGFTAKEQTRDAMACRWVLQSGRPLLIADAGKDARFSPEGIHLAQAAACRSYAGTPLVTNGRRVVGTLAVLAREPGRFTQEQLDLLGIVARQVMTRLELYDLIHEQEQAQRARQRTERALAMERMFVAATLDSIPALVVVLDTAGRIIRLNQSCAVLTGLSRDEAMGKLFVDEIVGRDAREMAAQRLREAASGQSSGPHETAWQMPRSAGSPMEQRRVSWTLRPLQGPNREIQYLIISGQDVTDQRQMEQALLSGETHYREVVENSLGFVFTCSMKGRLTSLNAFTAETLGYPANALTGRPITELMDAEGAAAFQECLQRLAVEDEWRGTVPLRRSDGIYRRIAFRSRRIGLPGERPFVVNHGMDITEQHEAEEALQMVLRQRELILKSAGDGIYGIDLEGRLMFINEAGAGVLGYHPEELAGRDFHRTIQHSHADGTPYSWERSPILRALREAEAVRVRDDIFWRSDGTAIPVEYSANPLMEEGQISGVVVAFQDVTERRRLERMKDEFISTVSHELRTPLTSLRASLGLVTSGTLQKHPEKEEQMIRIAIENCDRLARLVNDIVDFEDAERGYLQLHRRSVEASDLLQRAADKAHDAAKRAHIGFRIEMEPGAVFADERRVVKVLNELVTNAIKFSQPETTIRLAVRPTDDKPTEMCFLVEDQGRGIESEKLERIFSRFQQGDASDTRLLGGTGLGLALCRDIVEEHGGRIWVESDVGKGSSFLFTLPAIEVV